MHIGGVIGSRERLISRRGIASHGYALVSDRHCNIPYSVDVDGMRQSQKQRSIYGRNDTATIEHIRVQKYYPLGPNREGYTPVRSVGDNTTPEQRNKNANSTISPPWSPQSDNSTQ